MIIPNTKKVNCIVEAGVRYCEKTYILPKEDLITLIVVIAYVAWAMFWIKKGVDEDWIGYIIFTLIALPVILLAILLAISLII